MLAHTLSQMISLVGLNENIGTGDKNADDILSSGGLHQNPSSPRTAATEKTRKQAVESADCAQASVIHLLLHIYDSTTGNLAERVPCNFAFSTYDGRRSILTG